MTPIVSRLDVTAIFCEIDDFCEQFEQAWSQQPQLPSMLGEKRLLEFLAESGGRTSSLYLLA